MSSMTEERLKLLLYKYLAGNMTDAESQELRAYAAQHTEVWQLIARLKNEDQVILDLRGRQRAHDRAKTVPARKIIASLAAACLIVISILVVQKSAPDAVPSAGPQYRPALAKNRIPKKAFPDISGPQIAPVSGHSGVFLTIPGRKTIRTDTLGRIARTEAYLPFTTRNGLSYKESPTALIPMQLHTLATAHADMFQLTLPDSSIVWLNGGSSLKFPTIFAAKNREVYLTGEAFFQITRNSTQPFIVHVNDMQIEVLGTSFNCMAYENEGLMRTTLIDGSIRISQGAREKILRPNEQLIAEGDKEWMIKEADTTDAIAWRTGFFRFKELPLTAVIRQLSRWYDIDILPQESSKDHTVTAMFDRHTPLEKILQQLNLSFNINGKKITILE